MSANDDVHAFLARIRAGTVAGAAARVVPLDAQAAPAAPPSFTRAQLTGRLVELSARGASATTTAAIRLVRGAQEEGEPAAWIALPRASFYPPDVADCGVDLDALVVVRVADATTAARAAERLLRSGAFGLIVVDLVPRLAGSPGMNGMLVPTAHQGRLVTLAQQHDAAVVFLTEKPADAASLGSLISLRVEALRRRDANARFSWAVRALKDKRRGPGWIHGEVARAPAGVE